MSEPTSAHTPAHGGQPSRPPRPVPVVGTAVSNRFLESLDVGPMVLDAGMGTRLMAVGLNLQRDDPALWNLTQPTHVLAVHRRDVAAGALAIFSNTFGANRCWLQKYGRERAVEPINRRAVELARLAAGPGRWVIGDIGPTAGDQAGGAAEQAAILVDSGVDAVVLETFAAGPARSTLQEIRRTVPESIPLAVSLREWPRGSEGETAARRLVDLGASILGLNCRPGLEDAFEFAQRLNRIVDCPLLVKPSADPSLNPELVAERFAAAVHGLLALNVRLLGGCCGTTDLHVAALAAACWSFQFVPGSRIRGVHA